jgi:hypothetical protein
VYVTDSYRLARRGRLRTDLGGVYFNVLFTLGTALVYAATARAVGFRRADPAPSLRRPSTYSGRRGTSGPPNLDGATCL